MTSIFYAKRDGGLAPAGNKSDKYSPTSAAYFSHIRGNPGAKYPDILGEF
jgi:hypothetical protein